MAQLTGKESVLDAYEKALQENPDAAEEAL